MTDEDRRQMLLQLCDDDGVVRAGGMHHGTDYPCTGTAHFAGAHIVCANPVHNEYGLRRADLLSNRGGDAAVCDDGEPHRWQPVSFVFESQLLDEGGRVIIRQPSTQEGRVYLVCMGCHTHTYMQTEWVGYWLAGPHHQEAA